MASVSTGIALLVGVMIFAPTSASAYTYYTTSSTPPMVTSDSSSSVAVSAPVASSSSSAYPYFRRDDAGAVSSQAAPVQQQYVPVDDGRPTYITDVPKVGLSVESDRSEANPGDDVRYWIRARNLYSRDMPQWKVAFFFDRNDMQILDAGGGRIEGDHILFNVPASSSNEEHVYSVRVHLYKKLKNAHIVRVYASMVWDGTISPACSKTELRILEKPPVTGADDDYISPVEDVTRFLTPVSAPKGGWFSMFW